MLNKIIVKQPSLTLALSVFFISFCMPYISDDIIIIRGFESAYQVVSSVVRITLAMFGLYLMAKLIKNKSTEE